MGCGPLPARAARPGPLARAAGTGRRRPARDRQALGGASRERSVRDRRTALARTRGSGETGNERSVTADLLYHALANRALTAVQRRRQRALRFLLQAGSPASPGRCSKIERVHDPEDAARSTDHPRKPRHAGRNAVRPRVPRRTALYCLEIRERGTDAYHHPKSTARGVGLLRRVVFALLIFAQSASATITPTPVKTTPLDELLPAAGQDTGGRATRTSRGPRTARWRHATTTPSTRSTTAQ